MEHEFWSTQPVIDINEFVSREGPVKEKCNIKLESYTMHKSYEWCTLDLKNTDDLDILYNFFNCYYHNKDNNFKYDYTKDFLKWSLLTPSYDSELCLGVRVSKNKKLVGFISGIINTHQLGKKQIKIGEINFLCIHPKLRNKRLAVVLIKELTRRFNLKNVFQAFHTSDKEFYKPFAQINVLQRPINIKVLYESKFVKLPENIKLNNIKDTIKLPNETINNLEQLQENDLEETRVLLNEYLDKYTFHPIFNEEEFEHIFYDNKIVNSYIIRENNKIIDFVSFYKLNYRSFTNKKYNYINGANLFYYTTNNISSYRLVKDLLILARNLNIHVFTALDIMENEYFINDLHFSENNKLNYYMYNYKLRNMKNCQIGKVPI